MNVAELVGGALFDASDPINAGAALAELLQVPDPDGAKARLRGFDPAVVRSLRRRLPADRASIEQACAQGSAWVLGRRSAPPGESWEAVATVPHGLRALPRGLRRTTGETLVGLTTDARERIRLSAPYVDEQGINFLSDALAAATVRGVEVRLFDPIGWAPARAAMAALRDAVARTGDSSKLRLVRASFAAPFAHLKVVVVDGRAAYVGSANVTGAGLAGRNLELGVLVRGAQVLTIEALLDLYQAAGT
jgi:phosphatidylserine/phosphatidylglycerophosphate/cardiolipin synthase-like enzyme